MNQENIQQTNQQNNKRRFNKLAIVSFVLALIPYFWSVLNWNFLDYFESTESIIIYIIFYIKGLISLSLPLFPIITIIIAIIAIKKIKVSQERGKLVAISSIIIGIITLLFLLILFLSLTGGPKKSRDMRRISDIKQIQTTLELYFNDANHYPKQVNFGGSISYGEVEYMKIVPKNRLPNDGDCPENFEYQYIQTNNGQSYKLEYCLGEETGGISAGIHTATPESIANP